MLTLFRLEFVGAHPPLESSSSRRSSTVTTIPRVCVVHVRCATSKKERKRDVCVCVCDTDWIE
jgi:hypothetical protein